jgi:hypothetical protein
MQASVDLERKSRVLNLTDRIVAVCEGEDNLDVSSALVLTRIFLQSPLRLPITDPESPSAPVPSLPESSVATQ